MRNFILPRLFIFGSLLLPLLASAQVQLQLHLETYDNQPLQRAELLVQRGDSTIAFTVLQEPQYLLVLPDSSRYYIEISSQGYEPYRLEGRFGRDSVLQVMLGKPNILLEEARVQGRTRPRGTAIGAVFTLSRKAKATGDPFRALSELPWLQVDISAQTVMMRSGEKPLILVDGQLVNSGIAPIDPKFIESVELSEVVSARYLQMGVTKIINIRLRKERPLYLYTELRTRHDVPLREGFGGANFEVGRKKFAVSGNFFGEYLRKDRVRSVSTELLEEQVKQRSGSSVANSRGFEGFLLLKWVPAPSDYFSAFLRAKDSRRGVEGIQSGFYTTTLSQPFVAASHDRIRDGGYLASLYHEHTFANESKLGTYLKYSRGFYDMDRRYDESYGGMENTSRVELQTARNQYSLSVDYETGERSFGSVAVGNNLEYTDDGIKNIAAFPALFASVGLWSNYTHATYTHSWRQLYYMGSVGLQGLAVNATGRRHHYWRPRVAVSLTWRLPHRQSVRGSYYLTSRLPESRNLVTINQSTNPWFREEGNPYLVPIQSHRFSLNYECGLGDFQLRLQVRHNRNSQMIEPYLRQEGAVQVQSYRNNGTTLGTHAGLGLNYRGESIMVSLSSEYSWVAYNGQRPKGYVGVRGFLRWDFGDFFMYTTLAWQNQSYTAIGYTEYPEPLEANVQIAWQATKRLYLALALPYYWGVRSEITQIGRSGYTSYQRT